MQKKMIALAVAAALTAPVMAFADTGASSVSVYGVLDLGLAQETNAGNFAPTFVTGAVPIGAQPKKIGTVRGMMNGGESQSRWGIKGAEDLGNGNSAFFQLESAFSLGTGQLATSGLAGAGGATNRNMVADTALNGQLFNRMAFVGLSNSDLGAVTFGRQYSLQLDIIGSVGGGYDPVNAQVFSPINFSGAYGGGGATDNSRVDNAIKYANKFGNFNVNALYGMGGQATATSARSNAQANVGYEADTFGVQAAVQYANDTTGIGANAAPNTVDVTWENLTSYMLAGRWQVLDALTLKAGYEREQISAPGNAGLDLTNTNVYSYNIGANKLFGPVQRDLNVYWLGANYQFTPVVKGSIGYYDVVAASGTGNAAGTAATTTEGTDKYYSAMVEYNLSKKTNLYAAMMLDKKSGSLAAGGTVPSNFNTYGVGVRIKF
ncbi:outer membrane porin protein precursor [mine drainage metagenome]|uniref:Outer membrane porin protein n=1 Tax=mine drainage metagenome TaxID=410659 RepID=A0A1J5TB57_9ZZZZ